MSLERFQLPYMTTAQRTVVIPNSKDLLLDIDLLKIYVGDGVTTGGIQIGGSGGVTFVDNEIPSGTINGVNGTFTLAHPPGTTLHLYLNGLRLTVSIDYTITSSTITMSTIPYTGDTLIADYRY